MIPRILHQTWKTQRLPSFYATMQKRLRSLHPDWEYRLWTDDDNRAFVEEYYPDFLSVYDAFPQHIMRVDAIRYLIMDKIGGFYCDLDYEVTRPLDDIIQGCTLLLPKSGDSDGRGKLDSFGNSVFASVPGHPFWRDAIANLQANPPLHIQEQKDVEAATGPAFLTRVYHASPEHYDAFTPSKMWFHPPSDLVKQPNYLQTLEVLGCYGIHHCTGSWRTFQLTARLPWLQKLKRRSRLWLPSQLHWLVD